MKYINYDKIGVVIGIINILIAIFVFLYSLKVWKKNERILKSLIKKDESIIRNYWEVDRNI